jgi:hypothetical protein
MSAWFTKGLTLSVTADLLYALILMNKFPHQRVAHRDGLPVNQMDAA